MGLWDMTKDVFTGGGSSDINQGYDEARGYLEPYRRRGVESSGKMNEMYDYYKGLQGNLDRYNNAGNSMYDQINLSPNDYYSKLMGGYAESPEAKYAQEQAMRAANQGASASGMLGSGAYQKAVMQNSNDISQRDRQQYFNNVRGAGSDQMGFLQNLQGQQGDLRTRMQQIMEYLTGLGYNASSQMGKYSVNQGRDQAEMGRQTVGDIASMFGFGNGNGGLFSRGGNDNNSSQNNGSSLPLYALKAIMSDGMR